MEQSLILIKPDGICNNNIGQVINRLENKGLKITALKMLKIDESLARKHYAEHQDKAFFPRLLNYITKCPVVVMVVSAQNAIKAVRKLAGATNPIDAQPGTIRGDFAIDIEAGNVIHTSDSVESAQREIELFFNADEIYDYQK